jgi:hypothetical protein
MGNKTPTHRKREPPVPPTESHNERDSMGGTPKKEDEKGKTEKKEGDLEKTKVEKTKKQD